MHEHALIHLSLIVSAVTTLVRDARRGPRGDRTASSAPIAAKREVT